MKNSGGRIKRIVASLCVIAIAVMQGFVLMPLVSYAEKAGDVLVIRVQYAGEREDKIRDVARFSRTTLEGMSAGTYKYSSITSVGTVMHSIGNGPKVVDIVSAAGVDPSSVETVYFRTNDGYGEHSRYSRSFSMSSLAGTKNYYPMLSYKYDRVDEDAIIPKTGALEGRQKVPAILATKYYGTKRVGTDVNESQMSSAGTYRLCVGQNTLTENVETSRNDISSWDSVQSVFGIDLVLSGYPPITGVKIRAATGDLKIGSQTQIKATVTGGNAVTESDLDWSSSDESVASVSNSGLLTINGEGTATISAKASNGITATMTVTVQGKTVQKEVENPDFNPDLEEGEGNSRTMVVEETEYAVSFDYNDAEEEQKVVTKPLKKVSISEKHQVVDIKKPETISAKQVKLSSIPVESSQPQRADNTAALEKAEEYGPKTKAIAGGIGAGLFAIGAGLRIRRFYLEK